MGLFGSDSKSTTTNTTTNTFDSYNRDYAASQQALSGLNLAGDANSLSNVDIMGFSNTSGITLGKAGGSQIAFSAEQAKVAAGAVGGDFNFAEAGSIQNSAILTKVSGGGSAGSMSTGGSSTSSGSMSWWIYAIIAGVAWFFLRR